jgi:SAM-dependent methyltransferase
MNEEKRLQRARTFDEIADLYDRARPQCPDQLFDDLFAQAGMEPSGKDVLEIGCGTGQATLPLARRGCNVIGVEMGQNLARIARAKTAQCPNVRIVNRRFEEWEPDGASFDIVLAATSWHWLDSRVRYGKVAGVLRPSGVLAFTTGGHALPSGFDPFFTQIQACYEAIGAARIDWPPPPPDAMPDASEEINRSGYFEDVRVTRRVWTEEFTAGKYVDLMSTASDHRLMEPAKREWLFSEMRRLIGARPGARIRKHNLTILHVARLAKSS